MEMLEGKICRMEMEQEMKGEGKGIFSITGTWISLSNARSRFKEYGNFFPYFKGYFILANLVKITPPWTPQKNVSVGKNSIIPALLPAADHPQWKSLYWAEKIPTFTSGLWTDRKLRKWKESGGISIRYFLAYIPQPQRVGWNYCAELNSADLWCVWAALYHWNNLSACVWW